MSLLPCAFCNIVVSLQPINSVEMRNKNIYMLACMAFALLLCSCGEYNKVFNADYNYRYEAAKQYYADGQYTKAVVLLQDVISILKGTDKGEESLFIMALSAYKGRDYEASANFFKTYYQTYPKGIYAEDARYYNAMSLYNSIPEPKLDQTGTYEAVTAFQNLLDIYPRGVYSKEAQDKIFKLQDRLVEKEYLSAKTYYDLGSYFGNCSYGGSNYEACIITAQNALKDYPYTTRREEFSIMILRAKYLLALHSIKARELERLQAATEEYYAFTNEFPESKYTEEANKIFEDASKRTAKLTKKTK